MQNIQFGAARASRLGDQVAAHSGGLARTFHQLQLAANWVRREDLVPLNRWTAACWPATMGCMPSTWRKVTYLVVGGLTEVGFADGSLLLVVSHQGRGVADQARRSFVCSHIP